jgi:hypothetical protein
MVSSLQGFSIVFRRCRKIAKSDYQFRHIYPPFNPSICLSVRPSAWNSSAPTGRIFMKFDICIVFLNMLRKVKIHENLTRITSTLHEGQYSF